LRAALLFLGLLLPLNLPFSIPAIEAEKRFGWSFATSPSGPVAGSPMIQQVLRHGYIHGVLAGDLLVEIEGIPADSATIALVRAGSEVGDTLHLLVDRQGRRISLTVPVIGTTMSYTVYLWYRMVIAIASWLAGLALLAWRGRQLSALILSTALLLLAPVTASSGVQGSGFLLGLARAGWQTQAAAYSTFLPVLLLHFTLLLRRAKRFTGPRIWFPIYLALFVVLLISTGFLLEPMAWSRFGRVRQFRALVALAANLAAAASALLILLRRPRSEQGTGDWAAFVTLLVTGTSAILYTALHLRGEVAVSELLWRINGSTLILLPLSGAWYLLLPSDPTRGGPLHRRRLANTISVLLTTFYGLAVVGVAAVLLSVAGHRLNGGEWFLFSGILLATIIFSPVLRWSEAAASRYIFSYWRETEMRYQEFIERIGLDLTPAGIADRISDELPALLGVPKVSLILSVDSIGDAQQEPEIGMGAEVMPRQQIESLLRDRETAALVEPIQHPDGALIGALRLGARLEPETPQLALLGNLTRGVAFALRNAASYIELRRAQQELADAKLITSLGSLASGLAHEIKNPLAGLKMGLYLLEREGADPTKFQRIQSDLRRIDDLISGLLRFTHSGVLEDPTAVSLHNLIGECISDLRYLAEDREIRFQERLASEDFHILGSTSQLRVLISSLLRNALDAVGTGGSILVETVARGTNIEIDIQDTGPGIPAGLEEKIFEFSFSTKTGGTGLGLALARREAEQLGGRIVVLPDRERGALLRVTLPRVI
jgi:signal transduction histidine kinase